MSDDVEKIFDEVFRENMKERLGRIIAQENVMHFLNYCRKAGVLPDGLIYEFDFNEGVWLSDPEEAMLENAERFGRH